MKLAAKIYSAIIIALVIGSLFFVARERTEELLYKHARLVHAIHELERLDVELDAVAWKTAFMLYNNYDEANELVQKSRDAIAGIWERGYLDGHDYEPVREKLVLYERELNRKEEDFQVFVTLNSLIKNSTTYIPTLNNRYLSTFGRDDEDYLYDLSRITSSVFLASTALDEDFLGSLGEEVEILRARKFNDPERTEFNRVFLAHTEVFLKYLPQYLPAFQRVLDGAPRKILHQANEAFVGASGAEVNRVANMSLVITFAFVLSIGGIIYFLVVVERKHEELRRLHDKLEAAATTDRLTGLANRTHFDLDQENLNKGEAALLIVNIDGFKNVNDFFGHAAGDEVLKRMAQVLTEAVRGRKTLGIYRIGADDFGILLDDLAHIDLSTQAKELMQAVEGADFLVQEHRVPVNVSIGMSRYFPLLETADLALRRTKAGRSRFIEYDPVLGMHERVKANLTVLRRLRHALQNNGVIPYYMPLLNLRTGRMERYECLIRVEKPEGGLMYPNEFLDVAKESRLYGDLTRIMIAKSLDRFVDNKYGFAINLSIEDILDESVSGFLFELLEVNPGVGKRLTLEILESEEVENYEAVRHFVKQAKSRGCRISIDDFGAGYSNLQHLLNLEVDNLKIDASLIRDIETNANSRSTVAAIVRLARDVGISSVTAEFVHNHRVLELVREMGIDYAQGYYVGRPESYLLGPDLSGEVDSGQLPPEAGPAIEESHGGRS